MRGVTCSSRVPAQRRFLLLLVAFSLVHGLIYLSLVPPWQHYDEPTHFEYVRLIVERGQLPEPGDYSLPMRREIAASMAQFDFWGRDAGARPDLLSPEPPDVGISELHHPPFYYMLAALPQAWLHHVPVEVQLYMARAVSVLLNLAVVAAAWLLAGRL